MYDSSFVVFVSFWEVVIWVKVFMFFKFLEVLLNKNKRINLYKNNFVYIKWYLFNGILIIVFFECLIYILYLFIFGMLEIKL